MTEHAEEILRAELLSLYNQCTGKQQEFFNRMYKSVEEIPTEKIDWAIS